VPQHLPIEADADAISAAVARGFQLDAWMTDPAIKRLIPQLTKLPALPSLYARVTQELQSPNGTIENVAKLIAQDPVMTAKMLQVVNSAFFALNREITDPGDAVMFLGAERTKSLIMLAKIFSQFDKTKCTGFAPESLWAHCLKVGELARRIARSQGFDAKACELAFTAGLLHDIGKLLLAANLPDSFSQALAIGREKKILGAAAEQEIYGTTHAEVGACILGVWGLPLGILEAIAWHHSPRDARHSGFTILTSVHAANALIYETGGAEKTGEIITTSQFDPEYLDVVGVGDRADSWRELLPDAEPE
jgi:putative nucleotidyltransferase with HDIG domain